MRLADFLSPAAVASDQRQGVNQKSSAWSGDQQEPSFNDVSSKIKQRQHARKLFGAIDKAWVPSLKRIKADAFDSLKLKIRTEAASVEQ